MYFTLMREIVNSPLGVKESKQSKEWNDEMDLEFALLQKYKTWKLIELLEGKKPIR
jgi:hypothetical protein